MADTYTDRFRLNKQEVGGNQDIWGGIFNEEVVELMEDVIGGQAAISLSSSDYTLSTNNGSSDEARNMVLNFTGTLTANVNVITPNETQLYLARNNTSGAFTVTVKTLAGTGIVVPQGATKFLFVDGTDVVDIYAKSSDTALLDGNAVGTVVSRNVGTGDSDVPDNEDIDELLLDYVQATDISQITVGSIFPYAKSTLPSGFLKCDGTAVSRTTYANLFTAIGTTWGVGDGSTTFNLPDLRGRSLVGAGTGAGLTNRPLGETGGVELQEFTATFLRDGWTPAGGSGVKKVKRGRLILGSGQPEIAEGLESLRAAGNDQTVSGGNTDNMPPFTVANYIIRAIGPLDTGGTGGSDVADETGVVGFAYRNVTDFVYDSSPPDIPRDNTVPQQTEGAEFTTISYTPRFSDSDLVVLFTTTVSHTGSTNAAAIAMFRDDELDAVGATLCQIRDRDQPMVIRSLVPANGTAETTFKVRYGSSAGTVGFNVSDSGTQNYGSASICSFSVIEIRS